MRLMVAWLQALKIILKADGHNSVNWSIDTAVDEEEPVNHPTEFFELCGVSESLNAHIKCKIRGTALNSS